MEEISINSNINLCFIPMTKLKTTTVSAYIHRELCDRELSENAVLPYVLKRGCKIAGTSAEISKYLENLYGANLSGYTMKLGGDHAICFVGETISDKYAPEGEKLVAGLLKLILSVIFEPVSFTDEILNQEKKNAKDRISAELNNKTMYAMRRCGEEMCKGDSFALSTLGTVGGIDALNAENLKAHYDKIISSSVIDIYICGDCDIKAAEAEIRKSIENIAFSDAQITKSEIFKRSGEVKNITDHMEVAQGKLSMGFRTNTAPDSGEYPALVLMSSIFGGGAHSKLFNNVREKLSLCYYASSSLVKYKGIMYVNAGIEFENFQKAHDEILAQLEAIKNGEISELEFVSGVKALQNEFESYKDDQRKMQLFYLSKKLTNSAYDIDELKEKISSLTINDVVAAAKKVELDTVYFLAGKEEN